MKSMFMKMMKGIETTRMVMLNIFFLLVLLLLLLSLISTREEMPEQFILELNLEGSLVEQVKQPDFGLNALAAPPPHQVMVHDVITALKRAAKDERVVGLRLNFEKLTQAALPHLREVKGAIEAFKESEKPVVAYGDFYSQEQYYLAATADYLYLHPMGNITVNGFSLYRNYFRDALAKLEVDIHVFKAGKYKSAAAPFMQNAMSDDERMANKAWLETLWSVYKTDLVAMRALDETRIQYMLDHPESAIAQYEGDMTALFLAEGLIDGALYEDEANSMLFKSAGYAEFVGYKGYLKATGSGLIPAQPKSADNWVAVITGSGQILEGEHPLGTIGSDTMLEQLQTAADDERIKSVVLRLNTPGGSALASESIRHAVKRLRDFGKPVVVSMGSMAASGGYWIASAANEIWASPATLTGSIGVFGIVPNLSRAMHKLGVETDGLGTTKVAGALRVDMPLSAEMSHIIQQGVRHTYNQFIERVSVGRDIPLEEVEKLAQGRVWSGVDALKHGLVDQLGTLEEAIGAAARLAEIQGNYEPVIVQPPMNPMELILNNLLSEAESMMPVSWHSSVATFLANLNVEVNHLLKLNDPRGIYMLSEISSDIAH